MNEKAAAPYLGQSVRPLFRALAGLILVAALLATFVSIRAVVGDSALQHLGSLFALPGFAWLGRLCFYATWRGRTPGDSPYWPFASSGVLGVYILVVLVCLHGA